jgi:hypothetical protein
VSVETWLDTVDGTPNVCIFWGKSSTKVRPPTATVRTDLPPPEFTRSQWDDAARQWVDVTPTPPTMHTPEDVFAAFTDAEIDAVLASQDANVRRVTLKLQTRSTPFRANSPDFYAAVVTLQDAGLAPQALVDMVEYPIVDD